MEAYKAVAKLLDIDNNQQKEVNYVNKFAKRLICVEKLSSKQNKDIAIDFSYYSQPLAEQLEAVCKLFSVAPLTQKISDVKRATLDFITKLQGLMLISIYDTTGDSLEKLTMLQRLLDNFFLNDDGEN